MYLSDMFSANLVIWDNYYRSQLSPWTSQISNILSFMQPPSHSQRYVYPILGTVARSFRYGYNMILISGDASHAIIRTEWGADEQTRKTKLRGRN